MLECEFSLTRIFSYKDRFTFLYSLKTLENLWFSDIFRGYRYVNHVLTRENRLEKNRIVAYFTQWYLFFSVLKNFGQIHKKKTVPEIFFSKVTTLLKKGKTPVNFAKFFKNSFLRNTYGRPFLTALYKQRNNKID